MLQGVPGRPPSTLPATFATGAQGTSGIGGVNALSGGRKNTDSPPSVSVFQLFALLGLLRAGDSGLELIGRPAPLMLSCDEFSLKERKGLDGGNDDGFDVAIWPA
ncbi:hypothetical protein LTR28_014071 [Elasticomyces elasticus]|nr:hypothetical protein LTR28_014071 [Elasticomyces elasticus]